MSIIKFPNASGFTAIDNDLFYVQSVVSASAFSLLIRIFRATQGYGEAVKALSGVYLQKTTNLSKNTISKATKELESMGLLLVKRRARLASFYQVSVKGVIEVCKKVKDSIVESLETESAEVEDTPVLEVTNLLVPTEKKEVLVVEDSGFEIFWGVYDKKSSRAECLKVWKTLTKANHAAIMNHLNFYITSTPDKQYRKDPLNYLKNKCWEDEVVVKSAVSKPVTAAPVVLASQSTVKREVIEKGSVADNKVNEFFKLFGRKGK